MSALTRLFSRAGHAVVDGCRSDRSLEAEAMERHVQASGVLMARREARQRQRDFAEGHLIGPQGEPLEVLSVEALGLPGWQSSARTALAATRPSAAEVR